MPRKKVTKISEIDQLKQMVVDLTNKLNEITKPVVENSSPIPDTFNPGGNVRQASKRIVQGWNNKWKDDLTQAADLIGTDKSTPKDYRSKYKQYILVCDKCHKSVNVEDFEYSYYKAQKDEDGTTFICHSCRN
jgi:hypothetical protein